MAAKQLSTPFADLLPPLAEAEFEALKASVKADGVRDAVVVDEDGNVLDGHHRLKIDRDAPRRVVRGLSPAEKQAFVFQANFLRRNMSPPVKKDALASMKVVAKALRKEDPKKNTQRRVAMLLGVSQKTVSIWLAPIGKNGSNIPKYKASVPSLDARVKVPVAAKPVIVEQAANGKPQRQIAANFGVTERTIRTIIRAEEKQAEKKAEREATIAKLGGDKLGIHCGDMREIGSMLADDSVDLIFTDPPYDREAVRLYGHLAGLALRVLKPGGWCLAYSGHTFLPDVFLQMLPALTYGWTFAIGHAGGDLRIRTLKLQNAWKPVVGFYKPPLNAWWDWFKDFASGGKEKGEHDWQQAEPEAAHYIQALAPAGGVVCDPFCGSGTTCAAAKKTGRQWVGFDVDKEAVEKARIRLDKIK